MSIKKNSDGTWATDFRIKGRRFRQTFLTRDDARDFEFRMKYGVVNSNAEKSGKTLHETMFHYSQIKIENKLSKTDEKTNMRGLYEFLTYELDFEFIKEVKLIHLNQYQTFLRDAAARARLWDKIEEHRKREAIKNNQVYMVRKKPKFKALSASSVNRHFSTISDFFTHAKKWEWIESNPCAELELLPESVQRRKPWPSDEWIQKAIDEAHPWAAKVFFFLAHTGARPIGAKRLIRSDVEMENRRVKIKSMKGNGTLREHWVPMSDSLYEFFEVIFKETKLKPNDRVFPSSTGLDLCTDNLAHEMRRVTNKIGLHGYTLYGFRHKFLTDMANPSEDGSYHGNLEAARLIAGHADIRQTQRYNHTSEKIVRAELSKVSKTRNIKFRGMGKKEGLAKGGQKRTNR